MISTLLKLILIQKIKIFKKFPNSFLKLIEKDLVGLLSFIVSQMVRF